VFELDFIKNHEPKLLPQDLMDMIKHVKVHELKALTQLCHEGDDADCAYFVMQGCLVATYTLTKNDKQAVFKGTKNLENNPDEIIKALTLINMVESAGLQAVAD